MDKISYSTDIGAQMRDNQSTTATRNPNGGGIYEWFLKFFIFEQWRNG